MIKPISVIALSLVTGLLAGPAAEAATRKPARRPTSRCFLGNQPYFPPPGFYRRFDPETQCYWLYEARTKLCWLNDKIPGNFWVYDPSKDAYWLYQSIGRTYWRVRHKKGSRFCVP